MCFFFYIEKGCVKVTTRFKVMKKGDIIVKKISLLLLSLLLSAVVLTACGDKDDEKKEEEASEDQMEMPEPDLEGIPDVVAEVNGEEITKEDFELIYQQQFQQQALQAQMSGQEVDEDQMKEQTAESMVGQELITQEANKRFAEVSEEDIDKTIEDVLEQSGLESKEDLFAQIDEQGMDKDEFMTEVENQVRIDQLIAEEAGDTEPSEEEVKEAYEAMKAQQEEAETDEEVPEFKELKPQITEQLKQQKQAEQVQSIVGKLREKADVTIHI